MAKRGETKFSQELDVHLEGAELERKSSELATAVQRHSELEVEKSEKMAEYNREMKGLRQQAKTLASQVSTRTETRPVRCRRVQDTERFRIAEIREDTGECISVRDMTETEAELARNREKVQLDADISKAIDEFERQMRQGDAGEQKAKPAAEPEAAPPSKPKGRRGGGEVVSIARGKRGDKDGPAAAVAVADHPADASGFRLENVPDLSAEVAANIRAAGFGTLDALRGAVPGDLERIGGVDHATAERVLLYAEENFPYDEGDQAAAAASLPPPPSAVDEDSIPPELR